MTSFVREVQRMLRKEGLQVCHIRRGRHAKLYLAHQGRCLARPLVVPLTPGDWRALRNIRAQARRLIVQHGG